jgi:DNA-binding NtrC family response regulator
MAATNRDLEEEVLTGRFREDLFHRLNVISVYLPPLRDRREDIPILVNAFIENFNARYGKKVSAVNKDVLLRMEAYDWPGNVRELQNAVERAVILSSDDELHIEDILQKKMQRKIPGVLLHAEHAMTLSYAEAKEAFERSFVMRILTASKGSIAEAARLSGRYRSDIYRLAERYKINPDEFKPQGHL